jgi:A/G-specific adenine glycosylase
MSNIKIARQLVRWFEQNHRNLPWRTDHEPYHVWISEVMLQQTQVETVIPYYSHWMKTFPDVSALVKASEQDLLQIWEGLGYYSRARNIYKAALQIVSEYQGYIPEEVDVLLKLPGIGRSTAGAIASIAYGKKEPILDSNVKRAIARIFNFGQPVNSPKGEKELWRMIKKLLPASQTGLFNQAMMELGQTICLPRNPKCESCPLRCDCQGYLMKTQMNIPVRIIKKNVPHLVVVAAVIREGGKVLIAQRPPDKLMAGMWEFPGGKVETGEELGQALKREIDEELSVTIKVGKELGTYQHAYTHFRVTVHTFYCRKLHGKLTPTEGQAIVWVKPIDFSKYPMGKVDRMIATNVISDLNCSV